MKNRDQINNKYKWDLTTFCKNDDDFYTRLKDIESFICNFKNFEGKLSCEKNILEYFKTSDKFSLEFTKLYVYAHSKFDEDQGNSVYQEMFDKVQKVATKSAVETSFASVEICKLPIERLEAMLKMEEFADYTESIKGYIKSKKHMLSREQEEMIAGMDEFLSAPYDVFSKFAHVDVTYKKAKDSKGRLREVNPTLSEVYICGTDRELRKNTKESLGEGFKAYINTLATNYAAYIKQKVYFSKLRGFDTCLSASLYSEDVDESVYHLLIQNVRKNINIQHQIFDLLRRAMKLEKFASYDIYAPLFEKEPENMSIDDAVKKTREVIAPLGDDYVEIFNKSIKEKWYDWYSNKGKSTGAYSISAYDANPVMLLNFTGKDGYLETIVHEFGHSAHSYLSNNNQPIRKADYAVFSAEVASNVNEQLLYFYLQKNAKTREEKMRTIKQLFEGLIGSVYRQTMFSECEHKFHDLVEKGESLTTEKLCDTYGTIEREYMGDDIILTENSKYVWSAVPHFFYDFYVYKYATGFIASFVIAKRIYEGDIVTRDKYLNFLKSGCSASPIELLKAVGVDFTSDKVYDEVFGYIKEEMNKFEKLLKE